MKLKREHRTYKNGVWIYEYVYKTNKLYGDLRYFIKILLRLLQIRADLYIETLHKRKRSNDYIIYLMNYENCYGIDEDKIKCFNKLLQLF